MHENREHFINKVIEVEAMGMNEKDNKIRLRHARLIRLDMIRHSMNVPQMEYKFICCRR